jgi:DNA repair exonuclease SbcCD ATPase subunit
VKLVRSIVSKIGFAESKQTDFNDGIHFIFGKNNSGKTLISKSFIDTLYPENPSLVDTDAWDTMFATFTLQSSQTKVEIQRKGNKEIKIFEIASDGSTIKEEAFPLPVAGDVTAINCLDRLHMLFSKDAFAVLSYIPSPLDIQYYSKDFSKSIKAILLLDRSLYYCAFSRLFADKINNTDNYNAHVIAEIQSKIKHCKTKLDLIELKEQKLKKQRSEIEEVNERIRLYTNEINELQKKIEACNRYIDTLSAIDTVTQQLKTVNSQIKALQEKLGTIEKYTKLIATKYPQFKDFSPEKRNNIHAMQNIYRQIQAISEEIETIIFKQENKNHALARNLLIINILLALGVLFVFLKPIMGMSSVHRWFMVSLLILIQVSSIGYYCIYTLMHSLKKIVQPLQQQKEACQIKLETLLNQNGISLDGITIDEIYEFLLQYFEEYNEYNEKQIDLLTIQKEIDENASIDILEEEKRKLENNVTLLNEQLCALQKEIGVAIESAEHSMTVKSALQHEIDEKKGLIVSLQNKLNNIPEESIDFDDEKNNILQEIADFEKELNAINEKNKLINYIVTSFDTAIQRYYNDRFELLTGKIKTLIQDLTKNKFGKIDEEYIKQIITNSINTPNASLKYCIYLTAIFALYELLQQELPYVHLPLIIDDPFVLMDEDAMGEFTKTLQLWAENRQVIVFTLNSNIKKMYAVTEL